jgi:hypothetical protein
VAAATRAPPLGDNNTQRTVSATRVVLKGVAEAAPVTKEIKVKAKAVASGATLSPTMTRKPVSRGASGKQQFVLRLAFSYPTHSCLTSQLALKRKVPSHAHWSYPQSGLPNPCDSHLPRLPPQNRCRVELCPPIPPVECQLPALQYSVQRHPRALPRGRVNQMSDHRRRTKGPTAVFLQRIRRL